MPKTRGAARRLTASGAPKHGTVAKPKSGAAKQAAKTAKAKQALKEPRTGKQQRAANRLRREAREAAEAAESERYEAMYKAMEKAIASRREPDEEKDSKSLAFFKDKLAPTLAASGVAEDRLTELLDSYFILDSTKQQARAILAEAQDDEMEDAPAGKHPE